MAETFLLSHGENWELLSPTAHSFSLMASLTISPLTLPTSSLHRLVFRPRPGSVQWRDVIGWSSLPFISLKINTFFPFSLRKKKKERKVSVALPGILWGRQRSVHWHFDHARKREASQLSALPVFMELLTSILCVSLQFNLTRTTSPTLIRCISKKCFRSARRKWRKGGKGR